MELAKTTKKVPVAMEIYRSHQPSLTGKELSIGRLTEKSRIKKQKKRE